jgi:hypothetical protein
MYEKKLMLVVTVILLAAVSGCATVSHRNQPCQITSNAASQEPGFRRLSVNQYVDKMKAGWIGQMVGVGWGGPTEFRWRGKIIPEDKMPKWRPRRVNQFRQDDIYVEMTFLRTLEVYGLDASIRQAGIDFANSGYELWHANNAGRTNLRNGIAPPDSGHPKFNSHADDIDYQIEADYAGLISPGLPNSGIRLGEVFGRLMNYGDGLYGGQFVAGMYAEAFFETDMEKVVRSGLRCIPEGSQYHECIGDVLKWYKQFPNDWQKTWQLVEQKYNDNSDYRKFACEKGDFNIDAKINGAYIVIGLLYGKGDLDETIIISTRCGQDSDCNPSNAAGVLFTSIGFSKLPDRFTSALKEESKFSHTPYNFPMLVDVCEKLAREVVLKEGGRVEEDENGCETFVLPVQEPNPSALEQCWEPGPASNTRFTKEERGRIAPPGTVPLFDGKTFSGWEGDLNWFRIEDGAIVAGTLEKEIPHNVFLCTTKEYRNFELRLEAKLTGRDANAGIQFRSRRIPGESEVSGYQADMGGKSGEYSTVWGSLYDESRRNRMLAIADQAELTRVLRSDDWNDYVIRCEGSRIGLWINSYQTVDYTEEDKSIPSTGIIGLQIHGGPPSEAWYRNITIVEL